jgi:hypothetical protein
MGQLECKHDLYHFLEYIPRPRLTLSSWVFSCVCGVPHSIVSPQSQSIISNFACLGNASIACLERKLFIVYCLNSPLDPLKAILIRDSEVLGKMGTHISKVKSLSMDSWSNDQVEVCPGCPYPDTSLKLYRI